MDMEKEEALKRLEKVPEGFGFFIAPEGLFTVDELKVAIKKSSKEGEEIIKIESHY
jgi:hypothetical protein